MSLTISNTILDEEFRTTQAGTSDDQDVTVATFDASTIKPSITGLSLNLYSSPTGFPQHAEKTNFVSSSNTVTDYYLTVGTGGVATPLYVGTNEIFLYATTNPNIVVGRIGSGTTPDASGAVALIIAVDDSNLGSPNLWLCQYAPFVDGQLNKVDSLDQLDLTGLISLGSTYATASQVPFENFEGLAPGNNLFNVIFPSDGSSAVEMLITGTKNGALSTVNVSTTGIGAGSQAIDVGATLRIDTVQGMVPANVNEANEVNNPNNIAYQDLPSDPDNDGRVLVTGADFEITQVNPGNPNERVDLRVSAFDVAGADQGQTYLNNINSNGTAVQIDVADVIVKNGAGVDITASLTITQDGDSVIIRGLDDGASNSKTDGYQVFFTTDGIGFDRLLITNIDGGGSTCDVGNLHLTITVGGSNDESADLGAHLIFQDDGPNIDPTGNTAPSITDDDTDLTTNNTGSFSGLFTAPDYGADGSGTLSYILGVKGADVDSGLDDTLSGQNVLLSYDSATNTIYGKTATSGLEVFKITVNSGGTITLDQSRSVIHGDTTSFDETSSTMTADLITLTAKIVDSEGSSTGDSDTATVNIGGSFLFKDDGPAIALSANVNTPNDLEVANLLNASDSSNYVLTPGSDGLKSFTIVGPEDSSGTFRWTYDDSTHTAITGTYRDASNVDHNLYTLVLNPSTGAYTFTMIGTIAGTSESLGTTIIHAGGPTDTIDVQAATPSTDFGRIVGDSQVGAGLINASHGFVGVDNGNLDNQEQINLSLHKANGDLIELSGINIGTKSAGICHYDYFVHMSDGSDIQVGDDVAVAKNGVIHVNDPNPNDNVLIESITVFKVDGNAIKIGLGDIQFLIAPSDVQLGFTVEEKDGDNDVTTASFTVDIDGNNDGLYGATVNSLSAINPDPVSLFGTFQGVHQDFFIV